MEINKRIYKYELEITDEQTVEIPWGAQLLSVQMQNNKPCLWALVDVMHTKQEYHIEIIGTGNPMKDPLEELRYLDTFQLGGFVGHVFYKF